MAMSLSHSSSRSSSPMIGGHNREGLRNVRHADTWQNMDSTDLDDSGSDSDSDGDIQWEDHVHHSRDALKYFVKAIRREQADLDKESLFTGCMVLPMVAWSSGFRTPTDVHVAAWTIRFLMMACFYLQWWLLDALHTARVVFPSLDGVPSLCTYGQDTGHHSTPRGPNGILYERNRGNIESDYFNVMMRNGLAKVLDKLNMTNEDIGPVEYGMESPSCRFLCVVMLCIWLLQTLFWQLKTLNFLIHVPKMVFRRKGKRPEHYHFSKHFCSFGNTCQAAHVYMPPVLFTIFFVGLGVGAYRGLLGEAHTMHQTMFLLFVVWLPINLCLNLCFSMPPPDAKYSWIHLEKETEDYVRSWENAMLQVNPRMKLTGKAWQFVRSNMKNDLWSLLGKKDEQKVIFEPNSLSFHFFWCEVLPLFCLRLFILIRIAQQGIAILLNTGSIMESILNSLAITFLLELERLMYYAFAHKAVQHVMANLQPFVEAPLTSFLPEPCAGPCDKALKQLTGLPGNKTEESLPIRRVPRYRAGDRLKDRIRVLEGQQEQEVLNWVDVDEGEASGKGRACKVGMTRVWTIETIEVDFGDDDIKKITVSGKLTRALSRTEPQLTQSLPFERIRIDKFDKRFTSESRAVRSGVLSSSRNDWDSDSEDEENFFVWSRSETWSDQFAIEADKEPEDGNESKMCCPVGKKLCTLFCLHTYPLIVFMLMVMLVHFIYFRTYCLLQIAPFPWSPLEDLNDPYFFGDNRIFGGWMAVMGAWQSRNVTDIDNQITCAPFANLSGVVRMAMGCGATEDPV